MTAPAPSPPPAASLFERIAKVCHEANRAWSEINGDTSHLPWEHAPDWQRTSAIDGVKRALAGETPEQLHASWCAAKLADGWTYGPRKDATAKTHPCLLPYGQLPSDQRRKDHLFAAIVCALGCGKERWDVKTLTDSAAGTVNLTPVPATIAELVALPAPPPDPPARVDGELVTYTVQGTITLAKLEADSDMHIVLADGDGNTMIIEAVCPGCASGSPVAAQIAAVRQIVEARFPAAAAGGVERGLAVPATVTGVAFFDRLHGQDGVAPNGVELHPILSLELGASA